MHMYMPAERRRAKLELELVAVAHAKREVGLAIRTEIIDNSKSDAHS